MGLRDKYAYAIQTAKGKFDGSAQEKDGKLYFAGSVKIGCGGERNLERDQDDSRLAHRHRRGHQGRRAGRRRRRRQPKPTRSRLVIR